MYICMYDCMLMLRIRLIVYRTLEISIHRTTARLTRTRNRRTRRLHRDLTAREGTRSVTSAITAQEYPTLTSWTRMRMALGTPATLTSTTTVRQAALSHFKKPL